MSDSSSFEDLEVWKRSKVLAVEICGILRECPDYGFRDQITRSAVSVPSNISEGAERSGRAEFRQFLGYAKGSAGELRTQILIAGDLQYLTAEHTTRMAAECREFVADALGIDPFDKLRSSLSHKLKFVQRDRKNLLT